MVWKSSVSGNDTVGEKTKSSSGSIPTADQVPPRRVPVFEPICAEDARARAAVEQWRTVVMLLEPQVLSEGACHFQACGVVRSYHRLAR